MSWTRSNVLRRRQSVCRDTAEKPDAIDGARVIVQYVGVVRGLCLQFIDQGDVVVVRFAVALDADHKPVRELVFRPAQFPILTPMSPARIMQPIVPGVS